MESLVDLLPLLFIGLYYLLSSRRKARAKQAAATRSEAPQTDLIPAEAEAATPFQSFLKQLEDAMAESAEGPMLERADSIVVPEAPDVPASPLERLAPSAATDFQPVAGSFDSSTAVDHDRHGFGRENPLSEEAFERQPSFAATRRQPDPSFDPHGLRSTPKTTPSSPDWRRRLQHPEAARDAFVMQTIFGARGGVGGGPRARKR